MAEASDNGRQPRRHPRIGVDCWARAFVHHALHRHPARLDAMLKWLTRRYLRDTPVSAAAWVFLGGHVLGCAVPCLIAAASPVA
jgi:hypothetical protein